MAVPLSLPHFLRLGLVLTQPSLQNHVVFLGLQSVDAAKLYGLGQPIVVRLALA